MFRPKETFREDKLIGRTAHQYNEDGNMIFSSVNRAKKRKNYTMRYNYDGNKVVNQRYTKNNKIVREWDFRCKPEGETEESKVKSTVCEFSKENADGSYVKFERHERDGKLFLVKEFYTSDDALYKSQGYKNESMLAWENLYEGKNVHHKSYDKKGQVDYWDISVFNDEGKIISYSTSWNGKDRSVSEALYSYNEDGTLAEKKTTFKQKVTGITTFKYTK